MTPAERSARAERRRINRLFIVDLPLVELIIDIYERLSPASVNRIGEDSSKLDIVPAQFRVLVTVRPKYACRKCEDGVLQAPGPTPLIEGELPTEADDLRLVEK
jgi:transposase